MPHDEGDDSGRSLGGNVIQQRPEINIFRLQTRRFTDSRVMSRLLGELRQMFPEREVSGV